VPLVANKRGSDSHKRHKRRKTLLSPGKEFEGFGITMAMSLATSPSWRLTPAISPITLPIGDSEQPKEKGGRLQSFLVHMPRVHRLI